MTKKRIILFEYGQPLNVAHALNVEPNIWGWTLTNIIAGATDDHSVTGYYEYQQPLFYNVRALKVEGVDYALVTSLADCRATTETFFYDGPTTKLHIHFTNSEPPLGKEITIGVSQGYCYNADEPYFAPAFGYYYEPLLLSVPTIKKNIDPLFFGVLKYQAVTPRLINTGGTFDDWRSRNLYGQFARVLAGYEGDAYEDFYQVFSGFIEDDNRDFANFSVKIQDPRKGLSQPVATRRLTKAAYPNLNDDDVDEVVPVAYGKIYHAKAFRLNDTGSAPYTYLICDTTYNPIKTGSITVYNDAKGITPTPASIDYTAGTFTLSAANSQDPDGGLTDIFVDFEVEAPTGVDIIKDLMDNYDGKGYIASFWDITEVDAAQALCRETSLYIDSDLSLAKALETVCIDCDLRFFTHDDGTYTIRVYDSSRAPTKTILTEDWLDTPDISNNGSEYLSHITIGYRKNQSEDTYRLIEDRSYYDLAMARYKKEKTKTLNTNLVTAEAALEKSATMLQFSANIQDVIKRSLPWEYSDIEITDFVNASPITRYGDPDAMKVYEVLGVEKDCMKGEVLLTLREVEGEVVPEYAYDVRITSTGDTRITSTGDVRITKRRIN